MSDVVIQKVANGYIISYYMRVKDLSQTWVAETLYDVQKVLKSLFEPDGVKNDTI